jgi:4-amino-4-deoxy-L-arabinose transferase-like glycosyltransferase
MPISAETRQRWILLALTLFTFFFLLGSRALNEPDEGRYSEIAREMIETGNWLVPHFWYLPHLDKPPMTYWLVAASMKLFGHSEWAVRLPLALAGISGVWAVWLLGCSIGGRRAGLWSALILQSSLLYFVMARMLTPDIFLTQFVAWAMYFFWRGWLCLQNQVGRDSVEPISSVQFQNIKARETLAPPNSQFATRNSKFFVWHLAGWVAIALGFLTKGPIAPVIPLVVLAALVIYRRKSFFQWKLLLGGLAGGLALFLVLVLPWFLAVFRRIPDAFDYMVFGQAAGHLLGTTIKNRPGGPLYFLWILAVGLLPWTWLLGWIWRSPKSKVQSPKSEIQSAIGSRQSAVAKDAWVLLNVWAVFTFVLFSFSQAKLPGYILPVFPALAVLAALRFFNEEKTPDTLRAPSWVWRLCAASPLLPLIAFPLALPHIFHVTLPEWMQWQAPATAVIGLGIFWRAKCWSSSMRAAIAAGLGIFSLMAVIAEAPLFETDFKFNQTLKPLGLALRENFQSGDTIVCWDKMPQGLPFYSGGAISAANRPYLGSMDLTQIPFEFPGNRERLGERLLPDENALAQLLQGKRRVWIVSLGGTMERFHSAHSAMPLRFVTRVGQWELWVNR